MARFDVFWSEAEQVYLLDVQNDLIENLSTRVVIPLLSPQRAPKPIERLNPSFGLAGDDYVLMTDLMAAVPRNELGEPRANLASERDRITAALDMLFFGF